jgi:hypothetical protein
VNVKLAGLPSLDELLSSSLSFRGNMLVSLRGAFSLRSYIVFINSTLETLITMRSSVNQFSCIGLTLFTTDSTDKTFGVERERGIARPLERKCFNIIEHLYFQVTVGARALEDRAVSRTVELIMVRHVVRSDKRSTTGMTLEVIKMEEFAATFDVPADTRLIAFITPPKIDRGDAVLTDVVVSKQFCTFRGEETATFKATETRRMDWTFVALRLDALFAFKKRRLASRTNKNLATQGAALPA